MSTILKALRRLEQERSFEQSHSLQEHVVAGSGEAPRASSHFKALAIVASGIASACRQVSRSSRAKLPRRSKKSAAPSSPSRQVVPVAK